jgi:putative endonuclease
MEISRYEVPSVIPSRQQAARDLLWWRQSVFEMPRSFFVYIMTNRSRTLYVGVTNNLERRLYEHKQKLVPGFTSKYRIDRLVFFETTSNVIEREKQIKSWRRSKKVALIERSNPLWKDLSSEWESRDSSAYGLGMTGYGGGRGTYRMIRYEVIIYWSKDDGAFLTEVPELRGCMADGKTYRESVENAEKVIQEWIETARELGRAIPEPRGRLLFA